MEWTGRPGTDGSICDDIATYSWVLSTTNDAIGPDVKGGGFLPPSAEHTTQYSKRPKAAALYASLTWIYDLLQCYPNHNLDAEHPPSLPIPVDNDSGIKDLLRPITAQTSTFHLLSPDYDIMQLPLKVDIFHIKSHQDKHKPYAELTFDAQINVLANRHATAIHTTTLDRSLSHLDPGHLCCTLPRLTQITNNIPDYIHLVCHTPAMKDYLIQCSHNATGRDSTWDATTFDSITWQPLGEAFCQLTIGQ